MFRNDGPDTCYTACVSIRELNRLLEIRIIGEAVAESNNCIDWWVQQLKVRLLHAKSEFKCGYFNWFWHLVCSKTRHKLYRMCMV